MALVSVRQAAVVDGMADRTAETTERSRPGGDGDAGQLVARAARAARREQLAQRQRRWAAMARGLGLAALATFPLVAAFHIDVDPAIAFTLDVGSVMWLALWPAAGLSALRALTLGRARRRLDGPAPPR